MASSTAPKAPASTHARRFRLGLLLQCRYASSWGASLGSLSSAAGSCLDAEIDQTLLLGLPKFPRLTWSWALGLDLTGICSEPAARGRATSMLATLTWGTLVVIDWTASLGIRIRRTFSILPMIEVLIVSSCSLVVADQHKL